MRIIVPLLVLGVLILVHELGHFGVAKYFKIKVLEFWIFMGPKIFSWKRKETVYSMRILPIGGMVRMEGEENSSDDEGAFNNKSPWIRIAVIAAGPVMNILFAFLLLITVFSFTGYATKDLKLERQSAPAYTAGIREGDKLISVNGKKVFDPMDYFLFTYLEPTKPFDIKVSRNNEIKEFNVTPTEQYRIGVGLNKNQPVLSAVEEKSVAYEAGLRPGDRILTLNDVEMKSDIQVSEYILNNQGKPLSIKYQRGTETPVTTNVTPVKSGSGYVGLSFNAGKGNVGQIITSSVNYCISLARSTYYSIAWLVTGKVPIKDLSGPVGIVKTMGDAMESTPNFMDSLMALLQMGALISLSLGLFNLIPFPALDGSKILILLFEAVTRRKLKPEREAIISFVGLAILLTFMAVITVFDVLKFF